MNFFSNSGQYSTKAGIFAQKTDFERVYMTNRFTIKSAEVLEGAKKEASSLGHTYIGSEHLLLGIGTVECVARKMLEEKGADFSKIRDRVVEISGSGAGFSLSDAISPKCKKILEGALSIAKRYGTALIGTEHILYAICDEGDCVASRLLSTLGISIQGLKNEIRSLCEAIAGAQESRGQEIAGAPNLCAFGKSLNRSALSGKSDPLIGREREINRLIQILCRRTKNNPCLIGEPGVGKTAIVEGLARRICEGRVPKELCDKVIVSLDLATVVAGTKYRGEFEERMKSIINEARANPSIILFIDEIHIIMGAGGAEGAIDASSILKPSLARGDLQLIGATTIKEYRGSIEKDSALDRRLQAIYVNEPTRQEALEMLRGVRSAYESYHGLKITDEALCGAIELSEKYINDRFLPDKALDLLDEACASVRMRSGDKSEAVKALDREIEECRYEKENAILDSDFSLASSLCDKEASLILELRSLQASEAQERMRVTKLLLSDIESVVALRTKIPVCEGYEIELKRLRGLKKSLCSAVIGQDGAIDTVVSAIKRGRLGLRDEKRPIASFLFVGPTGVGKTLLAKRIATELFDAKESFIRLDMSEYSEKHSVSKLVGAPAGYVGYEDEGVLIEAILRNPYSVVLFDEIEKAHSDIYNLLLQILEDGVLTSSKGRRVSFKNAIIILTSNVGGEAISTPRPLGFGAQGVSEDNTLSLLKEEFPPEFLNRLDETVIFRPLDISDAKRICEILLSEIANRMRSKGIELQFSDECIDFITSKGFSKAWGAREIRRCVSRYIEDSLCDELLGEKIKENDKVFAKIRGDSVYYEVMNI